MPSLLEVLWRELTSYVQVLLLQYPILPFCLVLSLQLLSVFQSFFESSGLLLPSSLLILFVLLCCDFNRHLLALPFLIHTSKYPSLNERRIRYICGIEEYFIILGPRGHYILIVCHDYKILAKLIISCLWCLYILLYMIKVFLFMTHGKSSTHFICYLVQLNQPLRPWNI